MSKETSWLVRNDLASLEHAYESGEVLGMPAHCLLGIEMDFTILKQDGRPLASEQQAALDATRSSIFSELSLLVPKDDEQTQRKASWLQQIAELTPEELINYRMYQQLSAPTLDFPSTAMYLGADDSPETTLEFVFGNGLYQTGYYDNPGLFEMRTQAAKPTIAIERARRAVRTGHKVANPLGFSFFYKGDQTNFSVWSSGSEGLRPIHALDNPEGQEVARKAVAGILHAIRDSWAVINPPSALTMPLEKYWQLKAGPERNGILRVVPERFEQRLEVGEDDHELNALILMAGFAQKLTDPTLDTSFVGKEVKHLLTAGPGYRKERDLYLLRALQKSLLSDGRFAFPGVSELDFDRAEGMLSSIIGAKVYSRADASYVIKELLGCMSLAPDGTFTVDEQAFDKVVESNSGRISLAETPQETITERLGRIGVISNSVTITGAIDYEGSSGVRFHKDLADFVASPSLASISDNVLAAVRHERAAAFTHEEAVSRYYGKKMFEASISEAEKVVHLYEVLAQFPGADSGKVVELIRDELEQRIAWFAQGVEETKANKDKDELSNYRYMEQSERYDKSLALFQALGGREAEGTKPGRIR